jgi:hypothetical protein
LTEDFPNPAVFMTPDDAPAETVSKQQSPAPLIRRRFGRVNVDLPARFALGGLQEWRDCSIVNIGGGGVRLQTLERVPVGKTVSLRFVFEHVAIEAKARIVDLVYEPSNGGYFASAAFSSIVAERQQHIEARVAALRAASRAE